MSIISKFYDPKVVENKWQSHWDDINAFKANSHNKTTAKESMQENFAKWYVLGMFAYPSGTLHMGHIRNYTITDTIARFRRALGFNVLHPTGWDAFGLPAENAAIQHNVQPKEWTIQNISNMKYQFKRFGFGYDWTRELDTSKPIYYKHEQEMFLSLLENGLAYRKKATVNWDPVDCTVLANEQVINGKGWRSGANVEQKVLNQWFLKITDFAEDLLSGIELAHGWPEKVKIAQRNWIGKSEGAIIHFPIQSILESNSDDDFKKIDITSVSVYSTKPETLFGASFIAIAYNHDIVEKLLPKSIELTNFIKKCQQIALSEEQLEKAEKFGFDTGLKAINPIDNKTLLPIYIANFVIMEYGSGAVFGCPGHDVRDFEFATKYNLKIKKVIINQTKIQDSNITLNSEISSSQCSPEVFDKKNVNSIMINSNELNGLLIQQARNMMFKKIEDMKIGYRTTNYRLRDWCVSRQRYWGCPIPIIYCDDCGVVGVPRDQLPIMLPENLNLGSNNGAITQNSDWKSTKCPKCNKEATRETDTFDTFMESSWYFTAFCISGGIAEFELQPSSSMMPLDITTTSKKEKTELSPQLQIVKSSQEDINYWMPVDQYVGGMEHAILHLLYARFFVKALKKCGYWNLSEPFNSLITQGMICHAAYQDDHGKWVLPSEIMYNEDGTMYHMHTQRSVTMVGVEKMSKSKQNIVSPDKMLENYGADAIRMYILSDSPVDKDIEWNDSGVKNVFEYLKKLYNTITKMHERYKMNIDINKKIDTKIDINTDVNNSLDKVVSSNDLLLIKYTHKTIADVTANFYACHFNKAIANIRDLTNKISIYNNASIQTQRNVLSIVLKLLHPITPHITEELWQFITHEEHELYKELLFASWPTFDQKFLIKERINIAVQVNGKMKGLIEIDASASKNEVISIAKELKSIKDIKTNILDQAKIIYIDGKIINFVINN